MNYERRPEAALRRSAPPRLLVSSITSRLRSSFQAFVYLLFAIDGPGFRAHSKTWLVRSGGECNRKMKRCDGVLQIAIS